ncbi:MAG: PhzF family phenazine biosynthesis protein [Chloroflexi bacterium]|nr:PhzF family phenazine biosynthesis protein [Chloroflexota bacterium]
MTALVHVDAFTERPFAGNAAAVCLLAEPAERQWMQALAGELNLAATAFVWPAAAVYGLRWFSPTHELRLCGHGTLASAHVLYERGERATDAPLAFDAPAGRLTARKRGQLIELDFPSQPSTAIDPPAVLAEALGQAPVHVERAELDYLVELSSAEAVRATGPDFAALRSVDARGVIVTARADSDDVDFVSRFFAPSVGIDEDPVTGSAHCCLAPYWERVLRKTSMVGKQLSRRGGTVHVEVDGERVRLAGAAVTVARGELA